MQIAEGMIVDLRYYGAQDQISSLPGKIISHDPVGIAVEDNRGQLQWFPWTSVQRVIVDN